MGKVKSDKSSDSDSKANGSESPANNKAKKRSAFGRMRQRMMESVGKRDKTELSEEFTSGMQAIDDHKVVVDAIWEGTQRVIQPDNRRREHGDLAPKAFTHYDDLKAALTNAAQETMSEPPSTKKVLEVTANAYNMIGIAFQKFQAGGVVEGTRYLRYTNTYTHELQKEKAELIRRRIDMDDCRLKCKASSDMKKLEERGKAFEETSKAFEEQAEKMYVMMESLPKKKELHRDTVKRFMTCELAFHDKASELLRKAIKESEAAIAAEPVTGTSEPVKTTPDTK